MEDAALGSSDDTQNEEEDNSNEADGQNTAVLEDPDATDDWYEPPDSPISPLHNTHTETPDASQQNTEIDEGKKGKKGLQNMEKAAKISTKELKKSGEGMERKIPYVRICPLKIQPPVVQAKKEAMEERNEESNRESTKRSENINVRKEPDGKENIKLQRCVEGNEDNLLGNGMYELFS